MIVDIIGMVGASLFVLCNFPQVYKLYKEKNSEGISIITFFMLLIGEICMLIFAIYRTPELPLLLNFGFNVILAALICFMIIKYKKKTPKG